MTYAFTFDASACTGCKACQIACKDKHNLSAGVLWRRVYEVTGGTWQPQNDAWTTDVFAYNLSIACNHCVHPKCAGVCPADAYVVRADGIVYIDGSKCMGCGYCSWACPYAAPQYDPGLRIMTKCDFCCDSLDAGLPPACVAACPMRVLNFTFADGQPSPVHGPAFQTLWDTPALDHPFPFPDNSRTQPHLAIQPHLGMVNGLEKMISNQEEVEPSHWKSMKFPWLGDLVGKSFDELPLLIFTLSAQMAAGVAVFSLFMQPSGWNLLVIGALLCLAGLVSFLHLGTKKNAWRSIFHLRKSWLSREILLAGLFGLNWLVSFIEYWYLKTDRGLLVTAALGLGMVYSMARVYRLRSVPPWNSWRINVAFFMTTGILGLAGIGLGVEITGIRVLLLFLLAGQLALVLSARDLASGLGDRIRSVLLLIGMALVGLLLRKQAGLDAWLSVFLFLTLLAEEIIGRWKFYEALHARLM